MVRAPVLSFFEAHKLHQRRLTKYANAIRDLKENLKVTLRCDYKPYKETEEEQQSLLPDRFDIHLSTAVPLAQTDKDIAEFVKANIEKAFDEVANGLGFMGEREFDQVRHDYNQKETVEDEG